MGTPGAGKTSLLERFSQKNKDWKIYSYGTMLLEVAKKEAGIKHRDDLRKMNRETYRKLQRDLGRKLARMQEKEPRLIIDTHSSIKTSAGYLPGWSEDVLREFNIFGFILITAPIEDIIERRMRDTTRIRDKNDKEELIEQNNVNLAFSCSYSAISGAPLSIIVNRNGKIDEAVKKLEGIIVL